MLDSIGGANGVHFRKFQNKTLRRAAATDIRATRSSFSQLESYKQDSSDVPQKSDRGSINLEIRMAKGLVHHAQFIASQKWHSGNCAHQCWSGLSPHSHSVKNVDRSSSGKTCSRKIR
ncbi:hypothetical protein AVEN_175091-1 [Araneus ventricosus]|uniref:Uncharacterized protein n=1 Tax=Araneus ventricosus TaxID=182803 RepID=A0A4Y2S0K0_ARAVE|nr:hypothetical protein AVEN_23382-1 [Araneus ventricosus]GBN81018.1 hypothetical protein AVEN_175091-1 [Araneus ventricosus]